MKARKALKRLSKVEALLSGVLEQYSDVERGARELLENATSLVARVKKTINLQPAATIENQALTKTEKPARSRLTAEGRKKISNAAKKRWADARRKGVHAVTGRRLKRTA